jgi:putative endonuclease
MAGSHEFGRRAEDLAAAYLRGRGWRILARNWRFHHKEIDLVAERSGVVAFVEVRARSRADWGLPAATIGAAKRRELLVAARGWIARRGRPGQTYQFDAVSVLRAGPRLQFEHVEDAWRP